MKIRSLKLLSLLLTLCVLVTSCTALGTDISSDSSSVSAGESYVSSGTDISLSDDAGSGDMSDELSADATSDVSSAVSDAVSDAVSSEDTVSAPSVDTSSADTSDTDTSSDTSDTVSSVGTTEKVVPAVKSSIPASVIAAIPEYNGQSGYYVINNNLPYFAENELTDESYEHYSSLDSLGRCGVCVASIGKDLMPTEPRGNISSIKPTGWVQNTYSIVAGGSLYNRSHLIAFMLTGENANRSNLITGTAYFNQSTMVKFENMVCDYIKETGNHVLYRVTPIFKGNNLLANGVTIEAYSVEDDGDGICFCVYLYNVQKGIEIDYATGNNRLAASDESSADENSEAVTCDFILNTSSKKFHLPNCSAVTAMLDKNKDYFTGTAQQLIDQGYSPCGICHPDRQ